MNGEKKFDQAEIPATEHERKNRALRILREAAVRVGLPVAGEIGKNGKRRSGANRPSHRACGILVF